MSQDDGIFIGRTFAEVPFILSEGTVEPPLKNLQASLQDASPNQLFPLRNDRNPDFCRDLFQDESSRRISEQASSRGAIEKRRVSLFFICSRNW